MAPKRVTLRDRERQAIRGPEQGTDGESRVIVRWSRQARRDARAAYWSDLQHGGPAAFRQWVEQAIATHAARAPRQRVTTTVWPRSKEASTDVVIDTQTRTAMEAAIVAERDEGRALSRTDFIIEAVAAHVAAACERAGVPLPSDLPDAPDRLPRNPPQ